MLQQFKHHLTQQHCSENTIATYQQAGREYLKWYEGSFGSESEKLYRVNLDEYLSYLKTVKKLAPGSYNTKVIALKQFNTFLIEAGYQTEMIIESKDMQKCQTHYLNPSDVDQTQIDELRQIILIKSGVRNYAIITLMAYAGLRISEATRLKLKDINLEARQIIIHGKGDKIRIIDIGHKVRTAIREYLRECQSDSEYLFVSRQGSVIHRSVINKLFNQYSDAITPHTCRHFFCQHALTKGYSIEEVAYQAGHSNIQTTMRYLNPSRRAMQEKADLL